MTQEQSPFARFSASVRVADIEAQRKDFAAEVLKMAKDSISYGSFERELNDQLHAAGLPVSKRLAQGQVFEIESLPFTLVMKVERPVSHNREKCPTVTEAKSAELWPQMLPKHYGYIIHESDKTVEPSWAVSVWEKVLPIPQLEKYLLHIAMDAHKKTHWGVRYGTGEFLLIDTGGANINDTPLPIPF